MNFKTGKNQKTGDIASYAGFVPALPPPGGTGIGSTNRPSLGRTIVKGIEIAVKHPAFTIPVGGYLGALAGHVIPEFHGLLITKGPRTAVAYAGVAFLKGKMKSKSNMAKFDFLAAREFMKIASAQQKKIVWKTLENEFGPEVTNEIKNRLELRGGGGFMEPNWVEIYNKIYYVYLWYWFCFVFIPQFTCFLDEQIKKNPELVDEFYVFYSKYVLPNGYTISKENCRTTCSIICDEIFLLNID